MIYDTSFSMKLFIVILLTLFGLNLNAQTHRDVSEYVELAAAYGIDQYGDTLTPHIGPEIKSIEFVYFNGYINTNDPFTLNFGGDNMGDFIKDNLDNTGYMKFLHLRHEKGGEFLGNVRCKDHQHGSTVMISFDKRGEILRILLIYYPDMGTNKFFFEFVPVRKLKNRKKA